jgi:hypothetical protein
VIIWHGWGIVVVGIGLLAALAAGALGEAMNVDNAGTTALLGASLIPAGILTWFVGKRMNRGGDRTLLDPATGEQVVLRNRHSLFFIPVEWWGPIMIVGGAVLLITGLLPTSLVS